jgi:hypothetical protein
MARLAQRCSHLCGQRNAELPAETSASRERHPGAHA